MIDRDERPTTSTAVDGTAILVPSAIALSISAGKRKIAEQQRPFVIVVFFAACFTCELAADKRLLVAVHRRHLMIYGGKNRRTPRIVRWIDKVAVEMPISGVSLLGNIKLNAYNSPYFAGCCCRFVCFAICPRWRHRGQEHLDEKSIGRGGTKMTRHNHN